LIDPANLLPNGGLVTGKPARVQRPAYAGASIVSNGEFRPNRVSSPDSAHLPDCGWIVADAEVWRTAARERPCHKILRRS